MAAANTAPVAKMPTAEEAVAALEKVYQEFGPAALASLTTMARSVRLAEGIRQTRALVNTIVGAVMHLQGSALGFLTDKDKEGGYKPEQLVEPLTEAVLQGLSWTGNEMNVISGRCYVTKNGYYRLVRETVGVEDYFVLPGVPTMQQAGAIVPMVATFKYRGEQQEIKRDIPVKLNSGMGVDGAIGKATRKMHATVFAFITGSTRAHADSLDDDSAAPAEAAKQAPRMTIAEVASANTVPQTQQTKSQAKDILPELIEAADAAGIDWLDFFGTYDIDGIPALLALAGKPREKAEFNLQKAIEAKTGKGVQLKGSAK